MERRIKQQVLHRKKRWKEELLPLVQALDTRPNASYLQQPHVTALLQHLSDALAELLMTRPITPFPWLADYLRHACKLSYQIEHSATSLLMLEMHKKRRIIENALRDTKADEVSSKQLIRNILKLQQELELPEDECRLDDDDPGFLEIEMPSRQEQWSVDTSHLAFPTDDTVGVPAQEESEEVVDDESLQASLEQEQEWLQEYLLPQRDLDSYHFHVMEGVIKALVHFQLAAPSSQDAAAWFIAFLRGEAPSAVAEPGDGVAKVQSTKSSPPLPSTVSLFFKTNYELMRKIEQLKLEQREMHTRLERLQDAHLQLQSELAMRKLFIDKLFKSYVTARTHAIMDGTPVFLDSQKHWVPPGFLLVPSELSEAELVGLKRAETYLMQQDEKRWRFLLLSQKRYDASVRIQSCWKCSRDFRAVEELKKCRRAAAIVIQRNYFHYLFHRAVRLPEWCVVGREVLAAPSVALKCAISFQFYPKKDFPTGNYRRLSSSMKVSEMMEICRQEEECAGFSTDGAMKRFLPRKLSQLKDMAEREPDQPSLTTQDGLYVKIYPSKTEKLVNTGIIVGIPEDRFGLVEVVLDGIGVLESVPLAKLSDRWKRIRIKLKKKREKKAVKRTFVFGKVSEEEEEDEVIGSSDNNEVHLGSRTTTSNNNNAEFEKLDDDDVFAMEEEERRLRRRKRLLAAQAQAQTQSAQSPNIDGNMLNNELEDLENEGLIEYLFEDQATKRVVRKEPKRTFDDPETRAQVIADRKLAFEQEQARKYEVKKLESIVRLQCAWRSKRAREAFRQVIQLRAKEKEREQLVQQVRVTNNSNQNRHQFKQKNKVNQKNSSSSKTNLFSKLFRS